MAGRRRAVLIAGPTASGKSALALDMAGAENGVIVNADAMQVYDTLRVVTARPDEADMARAEHRLYGTVPASTRFSTGQWLNAAQSIIDATGDHPLIFVGGTGLYFDALLNGFADVPEIAPELTLQVQQDIQHLDGEGRLALLQQEDPVAADRLKVVDPQRLIRALAVKRATGRTLSSYQDAPQAGLLGEFDVERMVLDPDRDVLRKRISRRFEAMFSGGAVDEVKALLALDLDAGLPVMKAIGVREIGDWLDGRLGRDEAIKLAATATHQYAKRQRTWFRNRFADWPRRGLGGA
ncbi:tRNA delta(2)-isopentenylpyrophosphate transferase [Devosia epidermidihirudinis]|uniref:tRNA dimethylallyltransferase n=1 Tax=Devosia epidermidihirudinis TaxID=1293439 RepID=A0A0F5Q487_9HYPH|nr:tRNA (adenosine(37)-N6)-dimethylallyltransferase MiaA [Devosia epidermidihirudinis]KKC35680.1 tRNA delta(2)-isopentenylpyrophosphate transferase [Devosia epidermidihirudinis]